MKARGGARGGDIARGGRFDLLSQGSVERRGDEDAVMRDRDHAKREKKEKTGRAAQKTTLRNTVVPAATIPTQQTWKRHLERNRPRWPRECRPGALEARATMSLEHHTTAVQPQVPMNEKEVQDHHVWSRILWSFCCSKAHELRRKKRRKGRTGRGLRRRKRNTERRSSSYKTRLQHWFLISRASKHLSRTGALCSRSQYPQKLLIHTQMWQRVVYLYRIRTRPTPLRDQPHLGCPSTCPST